MAHHPVEPTAKHVWVRPRGDHGSPTAGVVVCWQHSPVHDATGSGWLALVASSPFGDALLLDWVGSDRLVPLRDPRAVGDER